jgi:hypothetical protein
LAVSGGGTHEETEVEEEDIEVQLLILLSLIELKQNASEWKRQLPSAGCLIRFAVTRLFPPSSPICFFSLSP